MALPRRFGRLGTLGVAFAGLGIWRRRRARRAPAPAPRATTPPPMPADTVESRAGDADTTPEEPPVDPDSLTSPGTIDDPELERQRAEQAAERERESRETSQTRFDELRQEEEAARARGEQTAPLGEPPAPADSD